MPTDECEKEIKSRGFCKVCGVDEAGRGPLAGPVCAAAVILNDDNPIDGLNDSKKLSAKKRDALYEEIIEKATDWSVAFATVEEIEGLNILNATFLAMNRAIDGLSVPADYAIIDGNHTPKNCKIPAVALIKGDSLSLSVSAASIIAKVTRDRYMCALGEKYDKYNFKKHKGYGTKEHIEAIKKYGASDIHRPSFLKNILSGERQ